MGWIIFAVYMFCGIMINLFMRVKDDAKPGSTEYKVAKAIVYFCVGILGLGIVILVLYLIGWIWYFFCGGFLLFEDQPFWTKVADGLMSLVFLGIVFCIIAVICGADPGK